MNEAKSIKISVIIVNYNVEFFLEQCLISVFKALEKIQGEVYVVDNNSIDGSVEMVKEKFSSVILIENKENVGFSRANNQALKIAKGEYHLLLNPDTIVEEDTFLKVVEFMDQHPDAGGLGVKMIDGKGNFLPESKRGLPTPRDAFYKIFGLSTLFKGSRRFGRYHLSYLNPDEIHEIEILSGAFMLMRRETLKKVGLLDEAFFMYGEDIDLSYRIVLGGYKNYYFPKTRIIHYKGESTKKSSVNYVFVFYNAMIIFAKKHFSSKNARLFSFLINLAIYFRASLALLNRLLKRSLVPLFDYALILTALFLIADQYQRFSGVSIPQTLLNTALPLYAIVWFITNLFCGAYDKPVKLQSGLLGSIVGTGIILMIYALLPKDVQFSRLIILIGGLAVLTCFLFSRIFLHFVLPAWRIGGAKNKRFAIVGEKAEADRVHQLLLQTNSNILSVELVSIDEVKPDKHFVGTLSQLEQVVEIHKIDEVIFCAKNISSGGIISSMLNLKGQRIDFKIAQPETSYLIGSNSIDSRGDLYVMDLNRINKPANQRVKRVVDVVVALKMLVLSPVLVWFFAHKKQFLSNMIRLLFGAVSAVGYAPVKHISTLKLPKIKRGILTAAMQFQAGDDEESIARLNLIYAKNHSATMDVKIILRNWRKMDSSR